MYSRVHCEGYLRLRAWIKGWFTVFYINFILCQSYEEIFFNLTGYGGLSLSIEGPSKADIECLDNEDGSCRVTYKPTEPGNYIINIKFSDEHVPGKNLEH